MKSNDGKDAERAQQHHARERVIGHAAAAARVAGTGGSATGLASERPAQPRRQSSPASGRRHGRRRPAESRSVVMRVGGKVFFLFGLKLTLAE